MQLHFQTFGQGAPLIILHGLFGSSDNWHSISRRLEKQFRVLAVDQRNHGHSPHSAEMNYPVMAEDLHELLQSQKLARAHLIGHSMGGKTAMEFALRYPESVDKLIVVDIAPRAYSPRHGQIFEGMLSLDLTAFQTRAQMEVALAPFIPEKAVRQFLLKNVTRDEGGPFRWRLNLRDILKNYDRLSEALAENRVCDRPALFLRGGESKYFRESDWEPVRRLFPRAALRTLPGAGHWVHADAPELFLHAVTEFLNRE
jgi:pimeloyl-ACP methyl ester carboxylesterase